MLFNAVSPRLGASSARQRRHQALALRWRGKSAVLTGARKGIGRAAALRLAEEGAGSPPAYAAAKAALISHAKTLAVARNPGQRGRVGSIEFPGGAWDRVKQGNRPFYDQVFQTIPSGRMGTPLRGRHSG